MLEMRSLLLIPIALLAFAALICPKPSLSALLLLIESGLLALLLGTLNSAVATALCLFCVPVLVANVYLEKCLPKHNAAPALNLFFGLLLFVIFAFFNRKLITNITLNSLASETNITNTAGDYSSLSILCIIFALFTIIISAFSIVNSKNTPTT